MIKRFLLSAALAVVLGNSAMALSDHKVWLDSGSWLVWQVPLDNGQQACVLKHFQPTPEGYAAFGLSQIDTRDNGTFHYEEDGIVWYKLGKILLQVDNNTPWQVVPSVNRERDQLTFSLGPNPATFLVELHEGSALKIKTGSGVRAFSLAGSGHALEVLGNCVSAIAAERNNEVTPLPAPVPAKPPLPPSTSDKVA
jgi:hypothetical protein